MRRPGGIPWNSKSVLKFCAIVVGVLALFALVMIDRGWSGFHVDLVVGSAFLFSIPLIGNGPDMRFNWR